MYGGGSWALVSTFYGTFPLSPTPQYLRIPDPGRDGLFFLHRRVR